MYKKLILLRGFSTLKKVASGRMMPSGNKFRILIPFREIIPKFEGEKEFKVKQINLSIGKVLVQLIQYITQYKLNSIYVKSASSIHKLAQFIKPRNYIFDFFHFFFNFYGYYRR